MKGFGEKAQSKGSAGKKSAASLETLLQNAMSHYKNGDVDKAKNILNLAIKSYSRNAFALGFLATLEKSSGNLTEAARLFQKSISLDKSNPEILHNYSSLLCEEEPEQALELSDKAVSISPNNSKFLERNGYIKWKNGKLNDALISTLKAIAIDPLLGDAYMNLGSIYKDLGKLDLALSSTQKSVKINSRNNIAYMNMGCIYQLQGNLRMALDMTLKSLDLNTDNPIAYANLGGIYKEFGALDKALESTLKGLRIDPNLPNAWLNISSIYIELGKLDEAIKWLYKALGNVTTRERAREKLAQIFYYTKRFKDGKRLLIESQNKIYRSWLLVFCLCLGEKEEFEGYANELASDGECSPRSIAAVDHANVIYKMNLDNGINGSTFDSIKNYIVTPEEMSDSDIKTIVNTILSGKIQSKYQGHLQGGMQTAGNILELPGQPFKNLRKVIVSKLIEYNQDCKINVDKDFRSKFAQNHYLLQACALVMVKGGSLDYHNHQERAWLTGTFYLRIPDSNPAAYEGAIEFSHKGPYYPEGDSPFKVSRFKPKPRDLNIFSSALFHRTIPFHSDEKRICIAFDLSIRE